MPKKALRALALALPLPLVGLLASLDFAQARGPFWLGTNADPSYAYLLNSLRVAEGRAPTHLDHPGVTVHWTSALVMAGTHAIAGGTSTLAEGVLAAPERHARVIVRVFIGLYFATMVLAGLCTLRLTNRTGLMWLVQATPFASPSCFYELTDLKPEPLLYVIAGLVMAGVCALLGREDKTRVRIVVLLGALVGAGIATKFTAVSLAAIVFVLAISRRERFHGLVAGAISFGVCTVVAWPEWRRAAAFISQLTGGAGLYGQNLAAHRPYSDALRRALIEEAPFVAALLAGLAAAFVAWHKQRAAEPAPQRRRALTGLWSLLAVSVVQVVLFLKHPYQPRYLLPAIGCTGLILALSAWLTCWDESGVLDRRACALLMTLCAGIAALQAPRFARRRAQAQEAARTQLTARQSAESSGCTRVSYYRASSPLLALYLGDSVAAFTYTPTLASVSSNEFFLVGDRELRSFAGAGDVGQLAAFDCVVFQGSPGGPGRPFSSPADFKREAIPLPGELVVRFSSPWESVFEVRPHGGVTRAAAARAGYRP